MKKTKTTTITVQGTAITILSHREEDYIHNPDFNYGEFAVIKSQAGLNSYKISVKEWVEKTNADLLNVALFGQTAKQWREANPTLDGNMRDHATIEQLLVLANLESMNKEEER
jgi:hypothetical protein